MPTCAIASFRLGGLDGVSVVARRWGSILEKQGWRVVTVAGEDGADRVVSGLGLDPSQFPPWAGSQEGSVSERALSERALGAQVDSSAQAPRQTDSRWDSDRQPLLAERFAAAVSDADLVVAANLCSLPLNLPASAAVARVLAGRRAILHHHDLPWQRQRFAHITELPPLDDAWKHVVVSELTAKQMAQRGIEARVVYNPFETRLPAGERDQMRRRLGVEPDELLAVHPVRAIARKNIPAALKVCEALGAAYWLTGPAEEGYDGELEAVLASAACRVLRLPAADLADLYAAADLVVFTSTWEGFGNPPVEAAVWRRPAVVDGYPVASELRALGFEWFTPGDVALLLRLLAEPDSGELEGLLARNRAAAERHLSMEVIGEQIADLLAEMGF